MSDEEVSRSDESFDSFSDMDYVREDREREDYVGIGSGFAPFSMSMGEVIEEMDIKDVEDLAKEDGEMTPEVIHKLEMIHKLIFERAGQPTVEKFDADQDIAFDRLEEKIRSIFGVLKPL